MLRTPTCRTTSTPDEEQHQPARAETGSPSLGGVESAGTRSPCCTGGAFAVLTGAGMSTDSGIPDYRGAGLAGRATR